MDEVGGTVGGARDDRSVDSGVSCRGAGGGGAGPAGGSSSGGGVPSGDERSGSRSSALSSSGPETDHQPSTQPHLQPLPPAHLHHQPATPHQPKPPAQPESPASFPGDGRRRSPGEGAEHCRRRNFYQVWRDPRGSGCEVRHVESAQHSRLLMSSPSAPYGALHPHLQAPPLAAAPYPYTAAAAAAVAAELWTKRYPLPPGISPAVHPSQLAHDHTRAVVAAANLIREQEVRELEKKKQLQEREKLERERQDREKLEKQRAAEQAVHKHFEESLRLAHQKQQQQQQQPRSSNIAWMNSLASSHQRLEDKVQVSSSQVEVRIPERMRQEVGRPPAAAYYTTGPAAIHHRKIDYPPQQPPQQLQRKESKPGSHLPKMEPAFDMYSNYPAYHPPFMDKQQSKCIVKPGMVVNSKQDLPNPPPLMADMKSSVIVKNDKSGLHHSAASPKLREYPAPGPPLAKSPYEYRSPSASPHPEVQNLASISKVPIRAPPQHLRASPLPPPHRQSPHRQSPHRQSPQLAYPKVVVPQATVTSYPYPTTPSPHLYTSRPRVPPRPAPPLSKAPLTPSPYQPLSQHNLPPPHPHPQAGLPPPPAAHGAKPYHCLEPPLCQMQPLDLNISSSVVKEEPLSPKRPATDLPHDFDVKKIKVEEEIKTEPEATPVEVKKEEDALVPVAVTPPAPISPAPPAPSPAPSEVTDDKSNSPGPRQSYPVHKLKKAWLQRHSAGEEPPPAAPPPPSTPPPPKKPEPVSLHAIGSMAVNSIKKPKPGRKTKELNGHVPTKPEDDSSSSDPDRKTSPQKRVPPKRKKAVRKPVEDAKRKKTSASSTDSDKESVSDKDSDSGTSNSTTASKKKEEKSVGKRRGRKPKSTPSKNGNDEESRNKKGVVIKEEEGGESPGRDSLGNKPTVGQLKKSGESFLQDGPCFEVAPKLAKCRECRMTPNQRSKNLPNIFCRFYAFRRLRYTKNGQLAIAGFSDPHRDATQEDVKLWGGGTSSNVPQGLDVDMSKFLLAQVGDQFCDLLTQEREATSINVSEDKTVAWKRVVQGVREMCDVCETTLFNFHWACGKCGFVVCIDCYKGRKSASMSGGWGDSGSGAGRERDELAWLVCTNRQAHEVEKLMLTQIIAADSLAVLGKQMHVMRLQWGIPEFCSCVYPLNGLPKDVVRCIRKAESMNGLTQWDNKTESDSENSPTKNIVNKSSKLAWLANVALSKEVKKEEESGAEDEGLSTLRQLLIRPAGRANGSRSSSPQARGPNLDKTLDEAIKSVIESESRDPASHIPQLKHYVRRYNRAPKSRELLPIRIMTLTESKRHYDVPHSWLCDGKLLRLLDPSHPNNYKIFQDQWKRGQPVMICDVTKDLTSDLWTPESFSKDFGDTRSDLVDCLTGSVVSNQPMKRFWDGFHQVNKRLKDDNGQAMLLKLKDWPPGEDFADMLPTRFSELMRVLPMSEYTQRNGRLNLASRLPECFVRPDLGPKMYTAYGSTTTANKATTNLHLDVSDAVNVMVHVSVPTDVDYETSVKEVLKAVDEGGCDLAMRRRVREKGQVPGALWHIYMARDADKIRDLLNKVAIERGGELEPHHDSIHDQSWYLDNTLRDRLYEEYGVEGFSIVQCLGDAIFIPAGAPHQVRNLQNCIKVAEDFVSPENVSHCFNLTQEFRDLTDTHTNHEDKLQIKNIMYHAVKDSVAVLTEAVLTAPHIKQVKSQPASPPLSPPAPQDTAASPPAPTPSPAPHPSTTPPA